jgi:hypothetical protein
MARALTKPKAAAKKTGGKAVAAKQKTRAVATKKQEPAKPEVQILAANTFAKFTGYVQEVSEESRIFEKGQIVYIVDVTEATEDKPTMYTVIAAKDVITYLEDSENPDLEAAMLAVQEAAPLSESASKEAHMSFLPIPSVGRIDELIETASGDLVTAARNVFAQIEEDYFFLGGLLAKIRQEGSYLVENGGEYEGETAWDDFCKTEFEFSGAKGGDLARMYVTLASIPNFQPDMLHGIGWTKIREIQRYVTEDNLQELLDHARETPKTELKVTLQNQYAGADNKTPTGKQASRGGGAAVKMVSLSLRMSEESYGVVQLALKEAQRIYGTKTDAESLEAIITAWAEDNVQSQAAQKRILGKAEKAKTVAAKATEKPAGRSKKVAEAA